MVLVELGKGGALRGRGMEWVFRYAEEGVVGDVELSWS